MAATYLRIYFRSLDFETVQVLALALFDSQDFELAWDLAAQVGSINKPLGRGPLSTVGIFTTDL